MLYADILRQANLHRGQKIDPAVGNMYLNEGMELLADMYDSACARKTATLTCLSGVWLPLPAGCLRVKETLYAGTQNRCDTVTISNGEILTADDTTLDIRYLSRCDDLIAATGTPLINEAYHRPLALFMAARDRQRVLADEDGDASRLMGEFMQGATLANARLANMNGRRRSMKAGAFR